MAFSMATYLNFAEQPEVSDPQLTQVFKNLIASGYFHMQASKANASTIGSTERTMIQMLNKLTLDNFDISCQQLVALPSTSAVVELFCKTAINVNVKNNLIRHESGKGFVANKIYARLVGFYQLVNPLFTKEIIESLAKRSFIHFFKEAMSASAWDQSVEDVTTHSRTLVNQVAFCMELYETNDCLSRSLMEHILTDLTSVTTEHELDITRAALASFNTSAFRTLLIEKVNAMLSAHQALATPRFKFFLMDFEMKIKCDAQDAKKYLIDA